MSAHAATLLVLSTRNVSADGAEIFRDWTSGPTNVDEPTARETLRAFARLSAMDLVEVEAKIYLTGPQGKVAVQNIGGRLFATHVPEAVNTAQESTPEQTLALVMRGVAGEVHVPCGTESSDADDVIVASAARRTGGWSALLNSTRTLVALMAVAAVTAYVCFWPQGPAGVAIVQDPAKVSTLHAQLNGRYGLPGATVWALTSGKLTGLQAWANGRAEEKRFAMDYRLGQRGNQVVLVLTNGALLELQPNGGLKFLNSSYPRAAN